jgi:hypothetical protein
MENGSGDKVAYHWETSGDTRTITYRELLEEVCRLANALQSSRRQGRSRDIYLGMVRSPDRDARLRADRGAALGRVRRVQLRGPAGPINNAEAGAGHADGAWRRGQVVPEGQRGRGHAGMPSIGT